MLNVIDIIAITTIIYGYRKSNVICVKEQQSKPKKQRLV